MSWGHVNLLANGWQIWRFKSLLYAISADGAAVNAAIGNGMSDAKIAK